jgi:hypothetical protein
MEKNKQIVWAVRFRYLDNNEKWHQKQTKWYKTLGEAWDEEEKLENKYDYLESSSGVLHKTI